MKTSRHTYDAEVAELARGMLERAAPVAPEQVAAERRAFAMMCMTYFADPRRAPAPRPAAGSAGAPGPGLPGTQELLTPVLVAAAAAVLTHLADKAAAAPAGDEPPGARIDEEQWREVRRIVTRTLMRHGGMPRDRAELMAAAVVGDGPTGPDPG
ncbi:hypothetical protein FNH09_29175 [Streptomyces adustus]|uniref:Uncharacterized protein n=1 Tax=Streptomyces adustus TaxID=1609272 RepID=A0A5N8VM56_9ACTN|nr:hypothetical protein [Streptomyces adustus]MPY35168.1 hypothetical protein [Streptomyces adustus]